MYIGADVIVASHLTVLCGPVWYLYGSFALTGKQLLSCISPVTPFQQLLAQGDLQSQLGLSAALLGGICRCLPQMQTCTCAENKSACSSKTYFPSQIVKAG